MAKMSTTMKRFKRERVPESLRELYPLWVSKNPHDQLACEYWETAYRYKKLQELAGDKRTVTLLTAQEEIMEQYLDILAQRLTLMAEEE